MKITPSFKQFIAEHADDDLNRLLLSASRYPDVDVPFAVEQISSRRQIREKLPLWYVNTALVFPSKIAAEQCSSEVTALYKQRLVAKNEHVCDLTGGLGIDSYSFSGKVSKVTYIERFDSYCEAARANFLTLGTTNVEVIQGDSNQPEIIPVADVFYLDPARRGEGNKRVYALSDCEPDLPKLLPFLWEKAPKVIAKISPMADIRQTLEMLPQTVEIHVISVKNECKELLFVMNRNADLVKPVITCVNFTTEGLEESFRFQLEDEQTASVELTGDVAGYLYEPNASVMKAGAFRCIAERFQLNKLAVNSHLYTSDKLIPDFPGRIFQVEEVLPFTNRLCKDLFKQIPKANITVRNFPIDVKELRKRTKIAEGGDVYLFATQLADEQKVLLKCSKPISGK